MLQELLDALTAQGVLRDPAAAAQAVLDREEQLSTGMEAGLAIPHGRTDAVDELVCAIGVSRKGIDFGSVDGEPTRIFVLVLTPESGADPYLQFVASIMGVLDEAGRQRVLAARNRYDLHAALTHRPSPDPSA